jgi:multidrug efflux system membrane fusion protein
MTTQKRVWILPTCIAIALGGCGQAPKTAEKPPVPVKVRVVEKRPNAGPMRYSGSLEPASKVDMAFRVAGYVDALGEVSQNGKRRTLEKGDFVKKGTMLARIRSGDYAQKVATANAQVGEARAQAKLATLELERAKRLFEAKTISKAELDAKTANFEAANAQVAGAVARSREAGVSLSDTVLRAPMDGVILSRQLEVGSLISPGQPVITIADTRSVKAVFGAPQSLVEKLQIGTSLSVFVGAESESKAPQKLLASKVTRIAPSADENGRVFSVEVALANEKGDLRPGSVVSVHVPDSAFAASTMIVPLGAVVRSPRDARGFSVFVLEGSGERAPARLRDVRLGEVIGNSVTVTDGLALDQRVVTVGATLLRDGDDAIVIR